MKTKMTEAEINEIEWNYIDNSVNPKNEEIVVCLVSGYKDSKKIIPLRYFSKNPLESMVAFTDKGFYMGYNTSRRNMYVKYPGKVLGWTNEIYIEENQI